MRKIVALVSIVVFCAAVSAAIGFLGGSAAFAAEKKLIMKTASATQGKGASYYAGHEYLKKRIEQLTDRVEVQIGYGTLGDERQLIEGVQLGTVEGTCTTSAVFANFIKEAMIFDVPFIFKDWLHVQNVLDGPYGDLINQKALEKGIRVLGWWQVGSRDIYYNASKPIRSPADLAGIKMRTLQSPVFLEFYRACGAVPVPMAWAECYVALRQKTIDGVDSILAYGYEMKHHEVVKYATITRHVFSPAPYVVSEKWWKTLAPDIQNAIKQAELEARRVEREADMRLTEENISEWEKYGVQIIRDFQVDKFREIAHSLYPKFEDQFGKENMRWIRALADRPK